MKKKLLVLRSKDGLHARPAYRFSQEAGRYKADIRIGREGQEKVNAKSIVHLLSLGLRWGEQVELEVNGLDEEKAFDSLCDLLFNGFLDK